MRAQGLQAVEERRHLAGRQVLGRGRLQLEVGQLSLRGGHHVEVTTDSPRTKLQARRRLEAEPLPELVRHVPLQRTAEAPRASEEPVASAREALPEAEIHERLRMGLGLRRREVARGLGGGEDRASGSRLGGRDGIRSAGGGPRAGRPPRRRGPAGRAGRGGRVWAGAAFLSSSRAGIPFRVRRALTAASSAGSSHRTSRVSSLGSRLRAASLSIADGLERGDQGPRAPALSRSGRERGGPPPAARRAGSCPHAPWRGTSRGRGAPPPELGLGRAS
jgi:hypothetical protein